MALPSNLPCSTYKTAQIVLVPPAIAPKNGYKVRWRVADTSTWYNYQDQTSTTINIVGVPSCYDLEVGITASCDGGLGTEIIVSIQGGTTCKQYILNDVGNYQYVPCGSKAAVSIAITSGMTTGQKTFCAVENTAQALSGGTITTLGSCTS